MTVPAIALTAPVGPDGAPLLVLGPSLGTSTILWENVVPVLADALPRRRVGPARARRLARARPSRSRSPTSPTPSPAAIRELGAERVLYAGVSLGGATGLELGLRHPELVVGAAIVASGAQLGEPRGVARARRAGARAVDVGADHRRRRSAGSRPDSIEREPDLSGRLLHALQDADDESYALCCEALAAYDVRDRLGEIGMPVLALWGEHDARGSRGEGRSRSPAASCDGRAEMIAGVAHLPPAEQPAATAAALLAFFESADALMSRRSTRMAESAPAPRARASPTASGTRRA